MYETIKGKDDRIEDNHSHGPTYCEEIRTEVQLLCSNYSRTQRVNNIINRG